MNKLSIIVPVFNEEKTILTILELLKNKCKELFNYEIIVIDDNSNDNTRNLLNDNKSLYDKIHFHTKRLGKGGAVRSGLKVATGDYIVFQDADLEYEPEDLIKIVNVIKKFNADLIIGSRFKFDKYCKSHNLLNRIGNFLITGTFNILFNTTFSDIYSCYVSFKKDLINPDNLKTNGFDQQAELIGKIVIKGKNFYEVPINYNGRSYEEGKKIRFYDFFFVILAIFKTRLSNK